MGGSVAVAFRFPDGEIIAQERHTNPLPFWFTHPRLLRGERDFIDRYIRDANHPDPIPVAPLGYGLVLVDYVSKTLFSMQGYTNLHLLEPVSVMTRARWGGDDEMEFGNLHRLLIQENRLRVVNRVTEEVTPLPAEITDAAGLADHAKTLYANSNGDAYFAYALDSSPLTVIDYTDEADSARKFLAKLDEIGFPLTDVDREVWKEWIAEREDEEE